MGQGGGGGGVEGETQEIGGTAFGVVLRSVHCPKAEIYQFIEPQKYILVLRQGPGCLVTAKILILNIGRGS